VVGLHPNTFKPHTGTKTSVLFVQKYTPDQLDKIAQVHEKVAGSCPDYEATLQALLAAHASASDVPEEAIPEAIADLMAENFSEPESEETASGGSEGLDVSDNASDEDGTEAASAEDRLAVAEEKLTSLKAALLWAKQKLMDIESDAQALLQKQEQEVAALILHWTGDKAALRGQVKDVQLAYKVDIQKLKVGRKDQQKVFKSQIKALEKQIPQAEIALKQMSIRGKLELMLADADLIGTLKERWIAAEVAKQLDYPIFMAVSERGGKDNSGDYKHLLDEQGSLVEFPDGHPQEGQLVIDQDLVNYDLGAADLADAAKIPDDQLCVAEAFVRFAQAQGLDFWEGKE